ncbi:MAG TPA: HEAT repeat domain-containing protein [Gemmataceae bacterium]|nr:HEAT repeat domain-containing protein [Gemmataceae bacterium]
MAVRVTRCSTCNVEFGITSYGTAFRYEVPVTSRTLSPMFLTYAAVGGGLVAVIIVLIGVGMSAGNSLKREAHQPDAPAGRDLTKVPEVAVADPIAHGVGPNQARSKISQLISNIRNENNQGQDRFVLANMDRRPELRGMPFIMGDACRQNKAKAVSFQASVSAVRDGLEADASRADDKHQHAPFWATYMSGTGQQGIDTDHGIAALTQILAPERSTMRATLLAKLKQSNRPEATRAIARSAVFDTDADVRYAAVAALKDRPNADYDDVLLRGLRYPLPKVARQAAQVMLALGRKDLLPQLAAYLDEAAPGDPVPAKVDGRDVCVVNEVVRINHHRNCLLCHPPSGTGSTDEVPGVIPIPGSPFPSSPKDAYGSAQSLGEPMVRADTTYLRQDFSVMMPVANAAPWPEMQRFDFLVRARIVEGKELAMLQEAVKARAADFVSANHQAALEVLRQLTGQDAAPNAAAWQRVIGANRQ